MTNEEIVARGKELYENGIRAQVESRNTGKPLVIDVETGEYILADTRQEMTQCLWQMEPKAERYLMIIGGTTYYRRGFGRLRAHD